MTHDHFVNSALLELQEVNRSPIDGYQYLPVLTLEEAIEKITQPISRIMNQVATAKQECNRRSTLLSHDESAAIYLYTMPITFFSRLNEALRAEDRQALEPWFAFLKLFMTALEKLPSMKDTVWRGVCENVSSVFADGYAHIWWSVNSFSKDLKVIEQRLDKTSTLLAIDTSHGKDISVFSAFPEEQEVILMPGTCVIAKSAPLVYDNRLFIVHLKEENSRSYVFELIKHEYQRHSRIERIVNPSKSFRIEQSYINLAIVETKEQQEKEKKLLNTNHTDEIMGTYEEIYGMKTKIEIRNIFEKCKDQTRKILVLGRAGIGKTTFCRYIAYQWATGVIWQEYELVILIHLRNLTESRYPRLDLGVKYSLIDLIKTEYFYDGLPEEYERLLKEGLDKRQVLWLLDGYDEIIQNIPKHLQYLLDQLLNKPHHILTSRPYLNTLSYNVQMEIIGFTDDNIEKYVQQFFDQNKDQIDNASLQAQKLLNFLKSNPRIWGIVHIPVNLELICSLWCDTDWSEITTLTMTTVYDKIVEWLCRRHLTKQNISSSLMTKEDVYTHLHKELAFLESLAFNGMKSKSTILPPKLLRIASKESGCSLQHESHLLNIGILKSLDYKPIGTCIEADKNHYFLHLSFQEHFTARYLLKALNGVPDQRGKAIEFIKNNKYNQRFELVFTFASGLLIECNDKQSIHLFWDTLLREPFDLIGLRHLHIAIPCLEEAGCTTCILQYREIMDFIIKWISYSLSTEYNDSDYHLLVALKRSPTIVNQPEILDALVKFYKDNAFTIKTTAVLFISDLSISNLSSIQLHLKALNHQDNEVKRAACRALGQMGEKAAIEEVINRLIALLSDASNGIRISACRSLRQIGEKAASNEVINRLMLLLCDKDISVRSSAHDSLREITSETPTNDMINRLSVLLGDRDIWVRISACSALRQMGEKAATDEVINRLMILIDDTNHEVTVNACNALGAMGEKAATEKVINRLVVLLRNTNYEIRVNAREALMEMCRRAANDEVANTLMVHLNDTNHEIRVNACNALEAMGEKAATEKVINRLMILLSDTNHKIRDKACCALGAMTEKASTDEVINKLMLLLDDTDTSVRHSACSALRKMGEKAATDEVINKLMLLLGDTDTSVRHSACSALRQMGEKAATDEMVSRIMVLLGDTNREIRINACNAFEQMGEKVATDDVINGLMVLLGDTDDKIIVNACNALGAMGEKASTDEVINKLILLLGNFCILVRHSACSALRQMGEKAAIGEVASRLMVLLGDTNHEIRVNACSALRQMGEKVATDDVINGLMILLSDTNHKIRVNACEALRQMGEKASTNEVINKLMLLLGDTYPFVRRSACYALGAMGEKAARNEVIFRLLVLLGDTNYQIRYGARGTLGKMFQTVASDEAIKRLLVLLGDTNREIRVNACYVLRQMGEKAATKEVIYRLLVLLGDTNHEVRVNAREALVKMFQTAASDEAIKRLLILLCDRDYRASNSAGDFLRTMRGEAAINEVIGALLDGYTSSDGNRVFLDKSRIGRILNLLPCMSILKADTVYKLSNYICMDEDYCAIEVSPERFMRAFLDTKIKFWLSIILKVFVRYGYGITVTETTVAVHDGKGSVELPLSDSEVGLKVRQYFANWLNNTLRDAGGVAKKTKTAKGAYGKYRYE